MLVHMRKSLAPLDRQIVAALQLNGRSSWKQVAAAIGASESTVTRRGQMLLERGDVFVTGVLDHLRCGLGLSVYVRMRVRPGRALAVAEAVSNLPTPRFVTVVTGAFDVVGEFVVATHADVMTIIDEVEHIGDVQEIESMVVIRKFTAFEEWNPTLLDDEAVGVLRSAATVTDYAHRDWTETEQLTEQEFAIAGLLAGNGRASYASIAAATGISESTAARRVESLVERGCLRFRTLFEPHLVGLDLEFMLWLSIEPDKLEQVGEALAKQPTTQLLSATTGRHNLMLQGVLPGYGDLYKYTTTVIGALPGVRDADTTIQVRTLKRAWVDLDENGHPTSRETA